LGEVESKLLKPVTQSDIGYLSSSSINKVTGGNGIKAITNVIIIGWLANIFKEVPYV
jgi:hypothetical protein